MCQIEEIINEMLENGEQTNIATVLEKVIKLNISNAQREIIKLSKDLDDKIDVLLKTPNEDNKKQTFLNSDIADIYNAKLNAQTAISTFYLTLHFMDTIKKYLKH